MKNKMLKVVEIFTSIQGEGSRTGEASIFIRLAGCNKNCWFCDTEWKAFQIYDVEQIAYLISVYTTKSIVWTGGEPLLQLNEEIIAYFKGLGYNQSLETNGTLPIPKGLDYVACSPKVTIKELKKIIKDNDVDEFRFVTPFQNDLFPPNIEDLPKAKHYYLSPVFIGEIKERKEVNKEAVQACLDYIKGHPEWKLSIQIHKLINIK